MWGAFKRVRPGFAEAAEKALATNPPTRATHWVIGGMMGCGKTTLAKRLAAEWDIAHIEIDRFGGEDERILHFSEALPSGWVAEANPWQVPDETWRRADWVVFLDYDNIVNYWRLLRRGIAEWRASGRLWGGFREHIIERTVKDLGRIVYLYGKENREGWRRKGIGGAACPSERVIRCTSPAEAGILLDRVIPSFKDRG